MSTVITYEGGTIAPQIVLGYEATRDGGNVIHPILGLTGPDVTFRGQQKRTGVLSLGFYGATSEDDSLTAQNDHGTGLVFTLSSTDRGSIEMSYVVAGPVTRRLDDDTRANWIVDVTFQEIGE